MSIQGLRKFSGWLGALACASLLAACGGGGGSPGTNPNKPDTGSPTVASVVVTSSSPSLISSGQAGTEVTLTALVKDANNSALAGQTVTFTASSGSVGSISGVSDASGVVTAKLSTGGDATLRAIDITAKVGTVTSQKIVVNVVQASLTLTTDSGTLASSGTAEATVTAVVRDSSNSPMAGVKVDLAVDSGSLTVGTRITDAQGRVSEKLSTGGDASSRVIKITGTIAGLPPVTASVTVVGTKIKVTTNPTVNVGSSVDVSVKLVDSAGNALQNKAVTYSSGSNPLTVKGGGQAVTNSVGQLTLTYAANAVPSKNPDTITVSAMGETDSTTILVSADNFYVKAKSGVNDITVANINTCVELKVHSFNGSTATAGSVTVTSSRGTVYTDIGCTSVQTAPTLLTNGEATLYVKAANPGVAVLTASIVNGGTAQGTLEFVAPLVDTATITMQADPAVIGTNSGGTTTQQATIRAEVRDGTAANNLVKGAWVSFSIANDSSGGTLSQPALVATGSDGAATVSYIAGSAPTPLNGVSILGVVQNVPNGKVPSATATLTVSKKSLFISAGTGREVGTPTSTVYTKDYAVLVTDASGNAVAGVNVTASVLPRHYRKGVLVFPGTDGPWQLPTGLPPNPAPGAVAGLPYMCPNEDVNSNGVLDGNEDKNHNYVLDAGEDSNGNGVLDLGEDTNNNGRLDPGIPITVTSSGVTDASGRATVTLSYPRDRALWLGVDLTIRGQVSGSEATYVAYIPSLPGLSSDYSDVKTSPPGKSSPYGTVNTYQVTDCANPN